MSKQLSRAAIILGLSFSLVLGVAQAAGTLSERTYKRITAIHELMGEENYAEALKRLDTLVSKTRKRPYEYATVMQTYGYAYAATSKYKQAIKSFEVALELEALPVGVNQGMRYNMAQLYLAIPDYKKAAAAYEQWFVNEEKPAAETFVFAASIYAQLQNYPKAIKKITTAISMVEKPKENWYQLLLAMYYQQKSYSKAAKTLEAMIGFFPDNPKYWKQLAGVHFTLGNNRKSLAVLELAHKRGFLETEKERMNLVNMYLFEQIPYKAAVMLQAGMEAGQIATEGKNLETLGEAWMAAQESDEAIEYLTKAAAAKADGKLYLRVAQLHAEKEDWPKTLVSVEKAQRAGGLKKPGKAYLVKGMALYEQGKLSKAIATFQSGLKYPESKKQAGQWIAHINNEREMLK